MKSISPLANQEGSLQQEGLDFLFKKKTKKKPAKETLLKQEKDRGYDLFEKCIE